MSDDNHEVGVEVSPGVFTTHMRKYNFDTALKRLVNAATGKPIEDDVEVFPLLSKDLASEAGLEGYHRRTQELGAPSSHTDSVAQAIKRFGNFRFAFPERMRLPTTRP